MRQVILLRYSEIHLKGKNRILFEKALFENINFSLKDIEHQLKKFSGRYIISDFNKIYLDKIVDKLTKIAGIYSFSVAYEVDSKYENILNCAKKITKNFEGAFKVSTNRADKTFELDSMSVSKKIGAEILSINNKTFVDLFDPKNILYIDIRENKKTYLFTEITLGVGGMPVGTSGKGLLLLSGGIDSPVAGWRMIKRGMKIDCIHFESFPHTSRAAEQKAIDLAKVLEQYNGKIKVFVVSVAKIQEAIHAVCDPEFMVTIVRRFMLRIAQKLAKLHDYQALITGESLGQVASQTIESMAVIGQVVDLPLLKPLIGYDKQETVELARKIDTYDISIKPYDDCCTVFLPDSPVIKPKLSKVLLQEKNLNIDLLIDNAINSMRIRFPSEE